MFKTTEQELGSQEQKCLVGWVVLGRIPGEKRTLGNLYMDISYTFRNIKQSKLECCL